MARRCLDECHHNDAFKEKYLVGVDANICCCECPAFDECKALQSRHICPAAKSGIFTKQNNDRCHYCMEGGKND